jgi:serine/threonine protein kinase
MSPEQIRASKDIDVRTDIWSMGCVLHELLTGRPAFDAPSLTQLSATILEEHPPKPSDICPGLPPELDAIVARCLEKAPDRRFQNMAELAMALYPFGPRRARHSAERCCMLLKVEGTHAEFELPSVRPPGWDSLPSGAYPAARAVSRVSAPEASSGVDSLSLDAIAKPRRRALLIGIAVGLFAALAVAFGILTQPRAPDEKAKLPPNSPTLSSRAEPTTTSNTVRTPESAKPQLASATAATPATARVEATATADKLPLVGVAAKPTYRAARPKKKSAKARGDASGSADPDPGF